jgi:hypothetical protein
MTVTTQAMATTKRRVSARQVGLKRGFRSGLEERTAAALQSLGVGFGFETEKLEYEKPARISKYTPDFIIDTRPDGTPRSKPLIIETKGRFLTADRQKHLLIKRQHPDMDIRFVFSNPNSKISKTSKTTYAKWCEKHDFLYAKEHIPRAWLEE